MAPLRIFTYVVDIGRHSRADLTRALRMLVGSLRKQTHGPWELQVFSNFLQAGPEWGPEVCVRPPFNIEQEANEAYYDLCFSRMRCWYMLRMTTGHSWVWMDAETIVTGDWSFTIVLDHFFVAIGGDATWPVRPFRSAPVGHEIPRRRYLQGNCWKLNLWLYGRLLEAYRYIRQRGWELVWDIQDLFNAYVHFRADEQVNVVSWTVQPHCEAGLGVWNGGHSTMEALMDLYWDTMGVLRSPRVPGQHIIMLSFTFFGLQKLWHTKNFAVLLERAYL